MKKCTLLLLILLYAAMSLPAQPEETAGDALKGPYLGQPPPGEQSKLFAPAFISTAAGELNPVFCCGGNEFYFSRRGVPGKPSTLMVSKQVNDEWTAPEPLDFSGVFNDIDLFIPEDGKSLIFCSRRPHDGGGNERADHDFWITQRKGGSWSEPVLFAIEALSEYEDFFPVLTASGNLYFNSQRGGAGGNNIYCAQYRDGKYGSAERLPEPVNSDHWEFDAFVAQDERMIIFSSTRPQGYGGADIYVSFRGADGSWSDPRNLGPEVNSENYEYGSSITPDGKYLFYTSTRNGSEDIFWISADVLYKEIAEAANANRSYEEIFMDYLMKNWDDVHDVIMRYHYEDPWLKGKAVIRMTWRQGRLDDAAVIENTTGDITFGQALIAAMRAWSIPAIDSVWSSALPIRTSIKGSDDPGFNTYGILTGKVTGPDGKPLSGVTLVLQGSDSSETKAETLYTNREGIFIQTLVSPGSWQLKCSKPGYEPITVDNISIVAGQHAIHDLSMKNSPE